MSENKAQPSYYNETIPFDENRSLLVNTFHGSIHLVSREIAEMVEDPNHAGWLYPKLANTLNWLLDQGYLCKVSNENWESVHQRYRAFRSNGQTYSKSHIIVTTYACNLACTYCFEKRGLGRTSAGQGVPRLDISVADAMLSTIVHLDSQVTDNKRDTLALFGGEPLLVPMHDIVAYILEQGTKLGYKFQIITNGVELLSYFPLLSRYHVGVQITLDGVAEVHDSRRCRPDGSGSFAEIVAGMDRLIKQGNSIRIRVNVGMDNEDGLDDLLRFGRAKGWWQAPNVDMFLAPLIQGTCELDSSMLERLIVRYLALRSTFDDISFSVAGLDPLTNRLIPTPFVSPTTQFPRFWHCGAGVFMHVYEPDGSIMACPEVVGRVRGQIGRFMPQLDYASAYALWQNRSVFDLAACRECKYVFCCGGGCPSRAQENNGSVQSSYCTDFAKIFGTVLPILYKDRMRRKNK